jgi:hypothetical protein
MYQAHNKPDPSTKPRGELASQWGGSQAPQPDRSAHA